MINTEFTEYNGISINQFKEINELNCGICKYYIGLKRKSRDAHDLIYVIMTPKESYIYTLKHRAELFLGTVDENGIIHIF